MSERISLSLSLVSGALLGVAFFGGLRWTVRRGVSSGAPVVWFFGSVLLRMSLCVGGFYLVSNGDWHRLLSCLLGFLVARTVLMRWPALTNGVS